MCPSEKSTALSAVEAIVYLVISPSSGPEYRLFTEEDILATGGIHAAERDLENDSYWFVCLGLIKGELDRNELFFDDSAFAQLPEPSENAWKTGRLNPAFGKSEVEKIVFKAAFEAIERMLDSWKKGEDGTVDTYTLKELKIGAQKLTSLKSGLSSLKKLHEVLEITVIKFWYDPRWPGRHLPSCDVVLAEYSLMIPVQFRWSEDTTLLSVDLALVASC